MTVSRPIHAFCSYASVDAAYRAEIETHLAVLKREGELTLWTDQMIEPGLEWDSAVRAAVAAADLVLLLVSPDFLASSYIWEKELKLAWQQRARVVPILIRPCDWKHTFLKRLQCLPVGGKPITEWPNRDAAWQNVTNGIRRVVASLRDSR